MQPVSILFVDLLTKHNLAEAFAKYKKEIIKSCLHIDDDNMAIISVNAILMKFRTLATFYILHLLLYYQKISNRRVSGVVNSGLLCVARPACLIEVKVIILKNIYFK